MHKTVPGSVALEDPLPSVPSHQGQRTGAGSRFNYHLLPAVPDTCTSSLLLL